MFLLFLFACVSAKKSSSVNVLDENIKDIMIPVLDLESEPLPLDETVIVAGETQKKEWDTVPENIKDGLMELEMEFNGIYDIEYKQDDDDYNSNRLLIEKKQEVLDFGSIAVLFYEKDRHFEERCASAFFSGYAELRYREMALNYSLPSHLSPLAKALLLDKLDKKGAPPRLSGAGLIERIINTYMRRNVKSIYADRALQVLAEYVPEKYTLPYKGAGVEAYVDALSLESQSMFIPKINWAQNIEQREEYSKRIHRKDIQSKITEHCISIDVSDEVLLFCRGMNVAHALAGLYVEEKQDNNAIAPLERSLVEIRAQAKGYWGIRLESRVRDSFWDASVMKYNAHKELIKQDVIPFIFEKGSMRNRSSFAKKEHAIGHLMRVKYNLRQLEERLMSIPKSKYHRRRYIKSYPKKLQELISEAKNVLHTYEDVPAYRRGMLLVLGRVAHRYYKNTRYAYKGTSVIAEKKLDQERIDALVLSKGIFRFLTNVEECQEICLEAKTFLKND